MPYIDKSKSTNWGTPEPFKSNYKDWFDPCPYQNEFNGLEIDWPERSFVNPPFNDLMSWSKKINIEAKKNKKIVLLMPARTDTKYFHDFLLPLGPKIEYIKGRLKFLDLDNSSNAPAACPFPCLLLKFN